MCKPKCKCGVEMDRIDPISFDHHTELWICPECDQIYDSEFDCWASEEFPAAFSAEDVVSYPSVQ